MNLPQPVPENRTYMIRRRCAARRFCLRPGERGSPIFACCFGVAAERYGLDVYWLSVVSNHHHDGVYDNDGKYPKLLQYFHGLLARCVNVHLSHWQNFWSTEQSGALLLGDAEAIFDKMVYSLSNAAPPSQSNPGTPAPPSQSNPGPTRWDIACPGWRKHGAAPFAA